MNAFLLTAAAVTAPSLLAIFRTPDRPPLRRVLDVVLLLHVLAAAHALTVGAPQNLFASLNLPLTATPVELRVAVRRAGGGIIPPALAGLVERLALPEFRLLYLRFGHAAVAACDYCHSADDFALFLLPRALAPYLRAAAVTGLLTVASAHRSARRAPALAALAAAAAAEAYWTLTAPLTLPAPGAPPTPDLHARAHAVRTLVLAALPAAVHLVPARAPARVNALPAARSALERVVLRLRLLRYAGGAAQRAPELRGRAERWWARDRAEGAAVRADDGVKRAAVREGIAFGKEGEDGMGQEVGPLRASARAAVVALMGGFTPDSGLSTGS